MLEPSAFQVRLELLLHVRGQVLALLGQVRNELRVVLLRQPVEPVVLGPVAGLAALAGARSRQGQRYSLKPPVIAVSKS